MFGASYISQLEKATPRVDRRGHFHSVFARKLSNVQTRTSAYQGHEVIFADRSDEKTQNVIII